jgi:hypothetical protein
VNGVASAAPSTGMRSATAPWKHKAVTTDSTRNTKPAEYRRPRYAKTQSIQHTKTTQDYAAVNAVRRMMSAAADWLDNLCNAQLVYMHCPRLQPALSNLCRVSRLCNPAASSPLLSFLKAAMMPAGASSAAKCRSVM